MRYTISITREFGSLGRPIAKRLSEILGIQYYDRDIIEETAKKMNLPVSEVATREENIKNKYFYMTNPLGLGDIIFKDSIFEVQKQIILHKVESESCIIVGRCSDFILKDMPNHFNIYIYAPYTDRIKNCIERLHMDQTEAIKTISQVDSSRDKYHMKYTKYPPNNTENKDILINSSILGVDGTAELLAHIIKAKFHLEEDTPKPKIG